MFSELLLPCYYTQVESNQEQLLCSRNELARELEMTQQAFDRVITENEELHEEIKKLKVWMTMEKAVLHSTPSGEIHVNNITHPWEERARSKEHNQREHAEAMPPLERSESESSEQMFY